LARCSAIFPLKAFFGVAARLARAPRQASPHAKFLRDRHAIRHIGPIRGFRPRQEFGHFGFQLNLNLANMFTGQRALPAGIAVDQRLRRSPRWPGKLAIAGSA
jgi:hypothetical protein